MVGGAVQGEHVGGGRSAEGLPLNGPARMGVVMRNTHERLSQLHPGRHEFSLVHAPGRGVVTTVRIPARLAALESGESSG